MGKKKSTNRVNSNVGSATQSFLNPSNVSTGFDTKWNQLNRITQGSLRKTNHEARNYPLRNQLGVNGRTQEFGSSLSSQERKRIKNSIKNHKLS